MSDKPYTVALVGNPNCGKTTLFNKLCGANTPVGNYPRVTLSPHSRDIQHRGRTLRIVDLPGTYSLTSHSPEERAVREFLNTQAPDLVVNILDAGNMARSLFLTTQLIEMGGRRIHALNMIDEAHARGISFDVASMHSMLGGSVVETSALTGSGFEALLDAMVATLEAAPRPAPTLAHDPHLEEAITRVQSTVADLHKGTLGSIQSRWLAIKLLEGDEEIAQREAEHGKLMEMVWRERQALLRSHGEEADSMFAASRFGFINGLLAETQSIANAAARGKDLTSRLDGIFLHRLFGLPLFFAALWVMLESTFSLGKYPTAWIEAAVKWTSATVDPLIPAGMVHDVVVDGVISGIGGTLVFLPNIVILFFFLALFSETGYLARTAFLVDRLMHPFGLHGKAFIPLVMGFDCNVPAIMATRTIESPRTRLVTILISPFMACSARLPVFILFAGAFFEEWAGTVVFGMYILSILAGLGASVLIGRFTGKSGHDAFAMELPPYRMPSVVAVWYHMWERAQSFLAKVGGVILVGSVAIWFLQAFPLDTARSEEFAAKIAAAQEMEESPERADLLQKLDVEQKHDRLVNSYMGKASQAVNPIFAPIGFDWRDTAAILTGIVAKEVVVASYAVLYNQAISEEDEEKTSLKAALNEAMPPLRALAFMVFIMLYAPCLSTIAVIMREAGSWRWSVVSIGLSFGLAWSLAWTIVRVGSLFS